MTAPVETRRRRWRRRLPEPTPSDIDRRSADSAWAHPYTSSTSTFLTMRSLYKTEYTAQERIHGIDQVNAVLSTDGGEPIPGLAGQQSREFGAHDTIQQGVRWQIEAHRPTTLRQRIAWTVGGFATALVVGGWAGQDLGESIAKAPGLEWEVGKQTAIVVLADTPSQVLNAADQLGIDLPPWADRLLELPKEKAEEVAEEVKAKAHARLEAAQQAVTDNRWDMAISGGVLLGGVGAGVGAAKILGINGFDPRNTRDRLYGRREERRGYRQLGINRARRGFGGRRRYHRSLQAIPRP